MEVWIIIGIAYLYINSVWHCIHNSFPRKCPILFKIVEKSWHAFEFTYLSLIRKICIVFHGVGSGFIQNGCTYSAQLTRSSASMLHSPFSHIKLDATMQMLTVNPYFAFVYIAVFRPRKIRTARISTTSQCFESFGRRYRVAGVPHAVIWKLNFRLLCARIAESTCCNGSPPAPKPPKPVKEKKPKKEKKDTKKGAEGAPDAKDGKSSGKDKGKDAAGTAAIVKAESKPTPFQVSEFKLCTSAIFILLTRFYSKFAIHRYYFPFSTKKKNRFIHTHTRHTLTHSWHTHPCFAPQLNELCTLEIEKKKRNQNCVWMWFNVELKK